MHVLVVEDEARMAGLLRRGLVAEGWSVDIAADADQADVLTGASAYDVIVCDIGLPGDRDGVALCRDLRRSGVWTPVLLLTARSAISDRVAGLDAGADDYLPKPFAFAELAARLRTLLRRGTPERPAVLTVGSVRLDPATREVHVGAHAVELTAREFALLEYFVRRPGQVLSRSELLDHVWDYAYDGLSNVVDVYVGYVRRKLAAAGARDAIATVRGAGYRLVS